MATKTLMSMEEFERLPDDGMLHELSEGELIAVTRPKFQHGWIAQTINEELVRCAKGKGLGVVFSEMAYLLLADPPTLRVPDVSFVRAERLPQPATDDYFQGAPDLAVEIVSPGDTAEEVERKVRQYLAAGAKLVWVLYPKTRRLHVFRADGTFAVLNENDMLEAPELFPGWRVRLADLLV